MKYNLVVCAIAKDELPYLLEWIAYYRVLGVDHFYFLDNESSDGSFQLLSALQKMEILTLISWPNRASYPGFEGLPVGPQVPGYNFVLQLLRLGNLADWVAFLDIDEFVVPSNGSFRDLIQQYDQHAGVALNWRIFGSSGHQTMSHNLVIERFTRCANLRFEPNRHVKCCVRVNKMQRANTHICYPSEGQIVRTNGVEVNYDRDGLEDIILDDTAVINHYFVKSRQEWSKKRNRGRATRPIGDSQKFRDEGMFVEYDRNEECDYRIERFVSATKREVDVLKNQLIGQLL
jgi:hypothetical protein